MNVFLTPPEKHFDGGLGMSASNFKSASETLKSSESNQSGNLPICYIQRHSIELYLKSLIYILHKKFDIPFGDNFNLEKPAILINNKWKSISNTHNLSDLFNYFLTIFNSDQISLPHTTDWSIDPKVSKNINLISGYDPNSTYFRYPKSLDAKRDAKKSGIQPIDFESAIEQLNSTDSAPLKCVLMLGDNDNDIEIYGLVSESLSDVMKALDETIEFMQNIHSAFIGELTKLT